MLVNRCITVFIIISFISHSVFAQQEEKEISPKTRSVILIGIGTIIGVYAVYKIIDKIAENKYERKAKKEAKHDAEIKDKTDKDNLTRLSTKLGNMNLDCSDFLIDYNSFDSILSASTQLVQTAFQSSKPQFEQRAAKCKEFFANKKADSLKTAQLQLENEFRTEYSKINKQEILSVVECLRKYPELKGKSEVFDSATINAGQSLFDKAVDSLNEEYAKLFQQDFKTHQLFNDSNILKLNEIKGYKVYNLQL